MPAVTVIVSAFASVASFLAAFGLLLPLLFLWKGRQRPAPAQKSKPMRLRVIGADGAVRRIEVARSVDELMDAARRHELSGDSEVSLRLHPRVGWPVRIPWTG